MSSSSTATTLETDCAPAVDVDSGSSRGSTAAPSGSNAPPPSRSSGSTLRILWEGWKKELGRGEVEREDHESVEGARERRGGRRYEGERVFSIREFLREPGYPIQTSRVVEVGIKTLTANAEHLVVRACELQQYSLERAIRSARPPQLPSQIMYYSSDPTSTAPIRPDAPHQSSLFLLMRFWMPFWLEREAVAEDVNMPFSELFYHRKFAHPDYLARLAPWLIDMGQSMDAVQHALALGTFPGADTQYFWEILLRHHARVREEERARRFELFNESLHDLKDAQMQGNARQNISDPVTLGDAFGVHVVRSTSNSTTRRRLEQAFTSNPMRIISLALHDLYTRRSARGSRQLLHSLLCPSSYKTQWKIVLQLPPSGHFEATRTLPGS
ncbi:uncharacterized protein SCHCODRAFT_02597323 [Schizophyllum commune H4-8]|uniref:Uncharacterized protein n=1 Tax=Schizophyllum commune (strain H4-8 / FGSC 9210) TaxID=578458 RepID=D8PYT9_SCHCM|nr:uncharacterized protein SCHCODRAFT_02597323 [Schizophyllum commune H4-8]KAI5896105.1 hypothetical protein SCHCODRAFT_02597323 [Schizophyllum commune H4-8]